MAAMHCIYATFWILAFSFDQSPVMTKSAPHLTLRDLFVGGGAISVASGPVWLCGIDARTLGLPQVETADVRRPHHRAQALRDLHAQKHKQPHRPRGQFAHHSARDLHFLRLKPAVQGMDNTRAPLRRWWPLWKRAREARTCSPYA